MQVLIFTYLYTYVYVIEYMYLFMKLCTKDKLARINPLIMDLQYLSTYAHPMELLLLTKLS